MNATGLIATLPDGTRLPGARATFVALVLAVFALMFLLVIPIVRVDDRGESAPEQFEGLYVEARTELAGEPVELTEVTFIEAYGAGQFLPLLLPVAMAAFSWYMHRKTGVSRPLTIGMLAMAVVVLFTGMFFIPALVALAIGSFQARKAELPARMAERMERQQDEDSDVIDADVIEDEEDLDDDDLDEEDLEDEYDDEDLDEEDLDEDEYEPEDPDDLESEDDEEDADAKRR